MSETRIIKTSYSALDAFKQCPLKYKFQVIDKIKTPKSKEAVFGSKIHDSLQFFHTQSPISPTIDELLNYLKENWDSSVFTDQQEDMIYFGEALKILKNYHDDYLKLKNKPIVLDTETRFEVLLKNPENQEQNCLLTGIIDRIDKIENSIEIVDYKTTKRFPPQEDVDNSLQLSLYCLGAINRWPQYAKDGPEKIKLTLYYLKHQESITTTRTKEQLESVQRKTWETLNQIEKSEFEPMPSALCDWCGYKRMCPMWKHLYKEQATPDDEQIKKIIDEFFELKKANASNNKKLKDLKEIIERYLDKEKIERVFGDIGYITRLNQVRYDYELEKIREILEPLNKWLEILSVDSIKLRKLLKTLSPDIKRKVENTKKISKEYKIIKASAKKIKKGDA
jgi:putative RecB family exonuclease